MTLRGFDIGFEFEFDLELVLNWIGFELDFLNWISNWVGFGFGCGFELDFDLGLRFNWIWIWI